MKEEGYLSQISYLRVAAAASLSGYWMFCICLSHTHMYVCHNDQQASGNPLCRRQAKSGSSMLQILFPLKPDSLASFTGAIKGIQGLIQMGQ